MRVVSDWLENPKRLRDTSLANALDWLVVHHILRVAKLGEKGVSSKQTPYEPGDRWHELIELHQHLAKAAFAL